ncbi:MAG: helix-turn-helix domain-containing protein [Cyanobacteria bacterium P01_D01_bin.71]
MKPGSKYYPLYQRLSQIGDSTVTLTLDEMETCLAGKLPNTARQNSTWWANRSKGGHQAKAWINAGYHTDKVDLEQQQITFKKFQAEYKIQRVDGEIKWDQAAIRALRLYMKLSQAQFAEAIGVRRQTISEWENGVYSPDRSTMKHLGLVAEKAAFNPTDFYRPSQGE